ncbi:MAG: NHL repeat-containing protein [Syntrophobacterales bacterium]|jgi:DNA-binding beta-propeller fold protein YncE
MTAIKLVSTYIVVSLFLLLLPANSYPLDCINSRFLLDINTTADQPSDISVGPKGDLYLVDGVNNRVIVFNRRGKTQFSFGKKGTGPGEFTQPLGIDISDQGEVFIADSGNHRIQVFDLKGSFLRMFTVRAGPQEKPSDPVDVLASPFKDYVYVSDNDNHKIRVYDKSGNFQFQWGKFGEGPGDFRYPGILAKNNNNEVYVVDVLNTRVQKFDPLGNYISDIGSWGVLQGQLFRPKGVAVDGRNRVFVSDSYMGLVQVFADFGRFLGVICESNNQKHFITPVGLFIDQKNDILYTVEMRKNKIHVTKIVDKD